MSRCVKKQACEPNRSDPSHSSSQNPLPPFPLEFNAKTEGGKKSSENCFVLSFPTKMDPVFILIFQYGSISEPRLIIKILNIKHKNTFRIAVDGKNSLFTIMPGLQRSLHVIPRASILPVHCDESQTNPCGGVKYKEEFSNAVPK